MRNGPLDMRMDSSQKITAADLLIELPDEKLVSVIKEYGEERFSKRIVRAIRQAQKQSAIKTTLQLSNIISSVIHASRQTKIHPATRTFQALRIAVNGELEHIKKSAERFCRYFAGVGSCHSDFFPFSRGSNCEEFF